MCQTDNHPAVRDFYATVSSTRILVSRLGEAVTAISEPEVPKPIPKVVQLELVWTPSNIPPKLAVSR